MRVRLMAFACALGAYGVAEAQVCDDALRARLDGLVALEVDEPIDLALRCSSTGIAADVRHRTTERSRAVEGIGFDEEALRELALRIGEVAYELSEPAPREIVPPPPPPPPPPPLPDPRVLLLEGALSVGLDGRGQVRGGGELGLTLGRRWRTRTAIRVFSGPEPGDAIRSRIVAAGGTGLALFLGEGRVSFSASAMVWAGIALATPDGALDGDRAFWFAASLDAGPRLALSERTSLALSARVGAQRRIDRRSVDVLGAPAEDGRGSRLWGELLFTLALRVGS
ncbi:MAG: hypothetical protein AAF645_20955 [Myxococcota bacterium]